MSTNSGPEKVLSFYGDPKLNPHVRWIVEAGVAMIVPKSPEDYEEGRAPDNPQLAAMDYPAAARGTDGLFGSSVDLTEIQRERRIDPNVAIGGTAVEASVAIVRNRPTDDFGLLTAARPGSGSM